MENPINKDVIMKITAGDMFEYIRRAEAAEARRDELGVLILKYQHESAQREREAQSAEARAEQLAAQLATAQAQLTRMTDWAQYWLLVDMKVTGANDLLVLLDDINTSRAMLAKDAKP